MKKSQQPSFASTPLLPPERFPAIEHWHSLIANAQTLIGTDRLMLHSYRYALRRLLPDDHIGPWQECPSDPSKRYLDHQLVDSAERMFRWRFEGRVGKWRNTLATHAVAD